MVGRFSACMACILVVAGCRTPDPSVDLLEAELRWLEDQIYLLDQQLDLKTAQLASCRMENAALRRRLTEAGRTTDGSTRPRAETPPPADMPPRSIPRTSPPELDQIDPDDLVPPQIDLGEEAEPGFEPPRPGGVQPSAFFQAGLSPGDSAPSDPITSLKLHPRLTGGYDFDGHPGDEGVMVVIQPLTADQTPRALPGPLRIEVWEFTGGTLPVAEWELDAAAVAPKCRTTLFGRGIYLRLPWPAEPPRSEQVKLVVWYGTPDGRWLEAQSRLTIDRLGTTSASSVEYPSNASQAELPADEHVAAAVVPAEPNLLPDFVPREQPSASLPALANPSDDRATRIARRPAAAAPWRPFR